MDSSLQNLKDTALQDARLSAESKTALADLENASVGVVAFCSSMLSKRLVSVGELNFAILSAVALVHSLEACKRGDFGQVSTWLSSSLKDPNRDFGKMALKLLPDVREALVAFQAPSKQWESLVLFEIQLFPYLPKKELVAIFGTQLLPFVTRMNFLPVLRQTYLLQVPEYDFGLWAQDLLEVMKKNREVLGTGLQLDDKTLTATVANWLVDFGYFVKQPVENIQSFDIVRYVNNAPNAKGLDANSRKVLLSILETFVWLHDPFVEEEDAKAVGFVVESPGRNRVPNSSSAQLSSVLSMPKIQAPMSTGQSKRLDVTKSTSFKQAPAKIPSASYFVSKQKLKEVVSEPELPAGEELLELTSGAKQASRISATSSDIHMPDPKNLNSHNNFSSQLAKIKEEVLTKRRAQEAQLGKTMDGFTGVPLDKNAKDEEDVSL